MHISVPAYTILFVLWTESCILRTETSATTLNVRDPSEACRISNFQCYYFLRSLSRSVDGLGSYL